MGCVPIDEDYFKSNRKTLLSQKDVILSVTVPFTKKVKKGCYFTLICKRIC